MKKVATRFAPSPTGPLHIGGVRTALFNWLYSKNKSGKYYLRIEDTDKERSKEEHKIQIINSLKWMGIKHDGEEYIQSKMIGEHVTIAKRLLENGNAYKCFCSAEEIEEQKKRAKQKKIPYVYNRKWRDIAEDQAPRNIKPVIRFKSKIEGTSILKDLVQGNVEIENNTIEDFVILRNDETPTYNLSASVDEIQIYEALGWDIPQFAHIPLIHTIDGKKLSKRDNASTLEDYSKIGILPESLRNYLLRLGWSYKDKEIFNLDESIKLFNLEGIGKSPSKLDLSRILSMNEYYIKNSDENILYKRLKEYCEMYKDRIKEDKENTIKSSLAFLKNKAKTLEDIFNNSKYILNDKVIFNDNDKKLINDDAKKIIHLFKEKISELEVFERENLEQIINGLIKLNNTNFKGIGQPLRIMLTGSKFGPGIYDIILSLGKNEVIKRLGNIG